MSRIRIIVLATGLVITPMSWNSDLQAQTSGGLDSPPGSPLLSKPAVQKELQLTEEQKSKLQKVTTAGNRRFQEGLETLGESPSGGAAPPETRREEKPPQRGE